MENGWRDFFEFMGVAGKLKFAERFSAAPKMPRETVGAHSWRLALLVMMATEKLDLSLDRERAYELAVAHDMVEAISGDVDYILIARGVKTKQEKHENEKKAMDELRKILPKKLGKMVYERGHEYADRKTVEAKFVYALDKIEALMSIVEAGYEAFECPEFIVNYADESVSNFPVLIPLLREIKRRLKDEFKKGSFEWKKEYDEI